LKNKRPRGASPLFFSDNGGDMNRKPLTYLSYLVAISIVCVSAACTTNEIAENKVENSNTVATKTTEVNSDSNYNPNSFNIKTYSKMSEAEQNKFVAKAADRILQELGFNKSEKVNGEGLELVKQFVDAYAKRGTVSKKEECEFGDNLAEMLKRGNQNAKDISAGFKSVDVSPLVGIYVAMIESEFCPCLQSPTGPLGMFQLTIPNAREFGIEAKRDSSPKNPDDRCKPNAAATAAAKLIKRNAEKADAGTLGISVAVMRYSSGPNAEYKVEEELKENPKSQESFWKMLAKTKTSKNREDKYLGKFIAAAIVGESPKVFGVDISPLSQVE